MLQRPKSGGGVVWDIAGTGWGIYLHPHRELGEEKFCRASLRERANKI
jgi:hypothetical protein